MKIFRLQARSYVTNTVLFYQDNRVFIHVWLVAALALAITAIYSSYTSFDF